MILKRNFDHSILDFRKALLKEEGICYFPPRKNTSTKEKHTTQASDQPENQQKPQNSRKYPVPKPRTENLKELYDIERETESESEKVLTSSSLVTHEGNKSPQFAKSKEEIIHKIIQETKPETKSYLSPNNKSNNKPNEIEKESSKNKASSKQGSVIEETKKMEKKILREKSRRKNAVGRPANTLNLNDVESKIREKVIRDKYIAKENMRSNDNRQEETIYMHGQKRQEDKFVLVENPNARPNPKSSPLYYKSKYEKPREESKLLESTTSVGQKSINLQNYSGAYTNLTPPQISTSRREAFNMSQRPEDSDRRRYEDHNNENYLGMLDIANSFLNSPLMNQLSGFEKSSGLSLKDSSHQTKNNYSNSRVGTFEVKSSRDRKSPYHSEIEEYNRNQDSMQNRYQEWNSGYRSEYVKSNSNLKESGNNRKYYAEPTKDSSNNFFKLIISGIFNREENSSLASSNFSNFLNEEMRGKT